MRYLFMIFCYIWPITTIRLNFESISGSHHILQKMVFILSNFILIAMALYKCNAMGLLPIHPSDWIAFASPKTRMEFAVGGPVLMSWSDELMAYYGNRAGVRTYHDEGENIQAILSSWSFFGITFILITNFTPVWCLLYCSFDLTVQSGTWRWKIALN